MKKVAIFVCAHKPGTNIINNEVYKVVQAGKSLHPEVDLGFLTDNTGDNISIKNPFYSELTVLYWGWKNVNDTLYKGLCHYRRYFNIDITEDNIDGIMKNIDMLTIKSGFNASKRDRVRTLINMTSQEDFFIFADTFLSFYPQYRSEFVRYFYGSRDSYPYQMFIARKALYDEYCEFLFPLLFELENRLKPHGYTRQKRTIGYIGEWMLGLFIHCKKIKVRQVPLQMPGVINKDNKLTVILVRNMRRCVHDLLDLLYPLTNALRPSEGVIKGLEQDGIYLKHLNK